MPKCAGDTEAGHLTGRHSLTTACLPRTTFIRNNRQMAEGRIIVLMAQELPLKLAGGLGILIFGPLRSGAGFPWVTAALGKCWALFSQSCRYHTRMTTRHLLILKFRSSPKLTELQSCQWIQGNPNASTDPRPLAKKKKKSPTNSGRCPESQCRTTFMIITTYIFTRSRRGGFVLSYNTRDNLIVLKCCEVKHRSFAAGYPGGSISYHLTSMRMSISIHHSTPHNLYSEEPH